MRQHTEAQQQQRQRALRGRIHLVHCAARERSCRSSVAVQGVVQYAVGMPGRLCGCASWALCAQTVPRLSTSANLESAISAQPPCWPAMVAMVGSPRSPRVPPQAGDKERDRVPVKSTAALQGSQQLGPSDGPTIPPPGERRRPIRSPPPHPFHATSNSLSVIRIHHLELVLLLHAPRTHLVAPNRPCARLCRDRELRLC